MTTTAPAKPNKFEPMDKVKVTWQSPATGVPPAEFVGTVIGFGQEIKTYRVALPIGIAVVYPEDKMTKVG